MEKNNKNNIIVSEKEALKGLRKFKKVEWKILENSQIKYIIIGEGSEMKEERNRKKKITLEQVYDLVVNMQVVLLDVQKQTNENSKDIKILKDVQQKQGEEIKEIKVVLAQHSQDIKEIKAVQVQHNENIKKINIRLDRIEETQVKQGEDIEKINIRLDRIEETQVKQGEDIKEIKEDIKMLKSFHKDDIKNYKK
ncbi:hypothetical protein [Mesomycoplasma lagogenitalium]|uniref:DUF16 domain-containing protein n=1 Tax=Mesomycoplasma lagogenitalium TaxID=171286 RepID=A0ABY8LSR2_9BACT|nr:hypothetical protein [Mesomycoplasma lagogenitalium]WGI36290.1 hypothetical protein QEG99_02310 [Mesomycoplasma lagogenitalium]